MIGDLGTPDATSIGISGASNKVNNSIFRRNLFSYTDGDAIRVYGDNNRIENNIFQYIDYSVSELPGLMVSFYINGDKNIFTKNSINNVQASATLTPGERSEFSYNKVTKTEHYSLMDQYFKEQEIMLQTLKFITITSIIHLNLHFDTMLLVMILSCRSEGKNV